jgi:hypothetical protein
MMLERWERDLEEIFRKLKAKIQPPDKPASPSTLSSRSKRLLSFLLSPVPRNTFLATILLVLVLLVVRELQPGSSSTTTPLFASPPLNSSYTSQIPGPGCDQGAEAGMWRKDTKHHENGVDVNDPYTSFTCQSNGLLITRTGYYNVFEGAFFGNPGDESLPNAYRVQVTAQITHGDSQAAVDLGVHGQSKYGVDGIVVRSNGQWLVAPFYDSTGLEEVAIASGRLAQKPTTITIAAEVHGALITVTINGRQVATVSDPHYISTSFLTFGVNDIGGASNPSALFSDFAYTPL